MRASAHARHHVKTPRLQLADGALTLGSPQPVYLNPVVMPSETCRPVKSCCWVYSGS